MKRKEAMALIEARHGSYAHMPRGYMDETDLLIMSSIEREKPKPRKKVKSRTKRIAQGRTLTK